MKVILNSNSEKVKEIQKLLKDNGGYCPCSILKNADTKCMRQASREQLTKQIPGFCHCELYEAIIENQN